MISAVGIKRLTVVLLMFVSGLAQSQITSGRIVFERKTNLMKAFGDSPMKKYVTEENKIKVDNFELFFNDTCSVFRPIVSNTQSENDWMTIKNSYYQNENKDEKLSVLALFGQNVYIKDTIPYRGWKVTDSKRKIGDYECTKAIYQKDDSTRLYAWFSVDIVPSTGPEGFSGLPGAILGLATEDGGIIYFAKTVEILEPKKEDLVYDLGKNKAFTMAEFKAKVEKEYGNTPWGKRMFEGLFRWL